MDDFDAHVTPDQPAQLEFFQLPAHTPRQRRSSWQTLGRLSLRYDHAVLLLIGGLIGCSVVFAMGVERGKRFAQAEQNLLESIAATSMSAPTTTGTSGKAADVSDTKPAPALKTAPAATGKKVAPPKAVAGAPKFAIQVVSYRQQGLAQRELQRLKQRGESAFLLSKHERVALVVGPFSSKAHAAAKLPELKQRYQDCFIRVL